MGYGLEEWKLRIAHRSDFTTSLVHLTRHSDTLKAIDVLLKIISEQKLIGSTTKSGFITGKKSAVCFQEAPIYSLAQNLYTEQNFRRANAAAKTRYLGFGLQFKKSHIFKKGGRPVIYENTEIAKSYLPQSEFWRIVNFDLSNDEKIIDWCHEREWRIPGDLEFELADITVILPNPSVYRAFVKKCIKQNKENILRVISGIIQLSSVFY